jgi:hypothetical protein
METSDSLANIAPALSQLADKLQHALKDSTNAHFNSTYASLASVIDTIKPCLAEFGLAVVQSPGWKDERVTVTTRILHASGEWIQSVAETPLPKANPQGVGSAITYLRRYSLASMLGISQEDDDGNLASQEPRAAKREPAPSKPADPSPTGVHPTLWTELWADLQALKPHLPPSVHAAMLEVIRNKDVSRYAKARTYLDRQAERPD